MERVFEDLLSMLGPGQSVRLETGSSIYRGPYLSHILDVDDSGVRIAVPMDQGKLVLLPVGTHINLVVDTPVGSVAFESEIMSRTGGRDRSLLLCPPPAPGTEEIQRRGDVPIIGVSSGKGGVGKTTFVVNLGIALSRLGKRVCVIDGDLGTANVDVVLNLSAPHNLAHVIHGEKHMLEVIVEGPEGIIVLPGGSGFQDLTILDDQKFSTLIHQFQELEAYADIILIDTGSGLSPSVTNFLMASSESIVITTPEPHAVTDCYALIKVLAGKGLKGELRLVINRAESDAEAQDIGRKMTFASRRFLQTELSVLGHIADDPAVPRCVRKQVAVIVEEPKARVSANITAIAQRMVGGEDDALKSRGARSFLERMRRLLPFQDGSA